MSATGWNAVAPMLQVTQPSIKQVEVAESAPFVIQSGIESCDDGEEDELETDDKLLLGASCFEEEEENHINKTKVLYQVQAIGDFKAQEKGDLSFKAGELLQILESSRNDGWVLAENALGEQGLVPSNHVQKCLDTICETTTKSVSAEVAKQTREGKNLWGKLKSNVKQTSLGDVLNAFGAVPSGFRESTLKRLLTESDEYHASTSIFPRLSLTGMTFKDLKWDYTNDQLQPKITSVCREFVIIAAKMIPLPWKNVQVLSRHVRVALFNKNDILSNIHTVRATWNQHEEKNWTFLPKNLTPNNSLFHRVGVVRTNTTDSNIELLFELCITFKKKAGEICEYSCGWSSLPLYDHNGAQLTNKTYELKIHGGTPFESGVELDPAQDIQATGGRMPSLIKRNKTPRLYIQLVSQTREAKLNSCFLPTTIVTSQHYSKPIGCFRQLVGQAFLSNRKGLPVPSHVYRASLDVFIKAIDQADVMDYTLELWRQQLRVAKRSEKANLMSVSLLLEKVLLEHTYPLLHSVKLPPPQWANDQREKERGISLVKFSKYQGNDALIASDTFLTPLNIGEQFFKVYP